MRPHEATTEVSNNAITELRQILRGPVLTPADEQYDDCRQVWNAMFDRRPQVVVRPQGAADIAAAVRFARDQDLELAIKGGGHNVAGNAVCDGGLMLDLSLLRSVQVDPVRRSARVAPGALLSDLDQATQAHGLATPAGFISSTGVAGLTLGGGFGYLSRQQGLTADNLRSVELVSAEGKLVQANPELNPDLFWGIRGGGGNFGVVSSFEFELHPVGPTVLAGPLVYGFEDAPAVLRQVATAMREAPDEVSCLPVIRHAPPAPFIPEPLHGKLILLVAVIHAGEASKSEAALAPFRTIGDPVADAVAPRPYTTFQSMFDKAAAAGARNYWKAHYLNGLSGPCVEALCEHAARMPSTESSIGMLSLGGAISRTPASATPYPHRQAAWVVNIQARWRDNGEDPRQIAWSRELFDALTPFATGGVYVNFISETDDDERTRAAYGEDVYQRLAQLKNDWDPDNRFHLNQNIKPVPYAAPA